jgi:F-type H+-transporting ATPase subunit b
MKNYFPSSREAGFLSAGAGVLLAASAALASAGGEAAGGPVHIDWWSLGVKIANFTVVAFLAVKYLSKPLADFLASRADTVAHDLQELKRKQSELDGMIRVYQEKLRSVDAEIAAMRQEARAEMDSERAALLQESKRAAESIMAHAQATIKREITKARADLFSETLDLSVARAENLVKAELTDKDHRRMLDDYLQTPSSKS